MNLFLLYQFNNQFENNSVEVFPNLKRLCKRNVLIRIDIFDLEKINNAKA